MNDTEFEELLALGHELQGIEFKGPGLRTDKQFAATIIRACLGMANRRGGGQVIIGVFQSAQQPPNPVGLSDSDALIWNYDELSDKLSDYADPSISFDLELKTYLGKKFVIISVSEFSDLPIICKKDYPDILRKGACYVRPRRKPETAEIPSQEDMRDLLDLATEKRLRTFILQANTVGLLPNTNSSSESDEDKFAFQAKDLLG